MATPENAEIIDRFEEFYRTYYRNEIGELAQKYPNEQRSLYVDWQDLYRFDPDMADDFIAQPEQMRDYAEEALRLYDLPVDVKLGQAHVRIQNIGSSTGIRNIRADHVGDLIAVQGIVRKATGVRPKIKEAAFECQRCGTQTYVPQVDGDFQEPHQCNGCERQGPFKINFDQSKFVDAQKLRVQESPEGLSGGETPESIDIHIEDDITGRVTAGDHVTVTGILNLEQQGSKQEKSTFFDFHMEGSSIVIEDEEFEEMDITEEDKREIIELSNDPDIYEKMVGSMAPSIFGYEQQKMAIILQLFSGVTKNLPDGSRIRGDLHMLLIGDPGTGKCVRGDTRVTLADGSEVEIRNLVESNLTDPTPIDDGVYDEVDFEVPSMESDGTLSMRRATKVWKREAPERMYRIRTETGYEIEVTPSHPLFVETPSGPRAIRAENLDVGRGVLVSDPRPAVTDGGTISGVQPVRSTQNGSVRGVRSDGIEDIEPVTPEYDWVYDLEIEGTHNYLSNNVVSHNSQLLQYVRKLAPRSVYTSGKGSSSAGLCVTGDTLIHTEDGFQEIRELARQRHPNPVTEDTKADFELGIHTFDREAGTVVQRGSSHVWRMPKKPCRRIETSHGKELEASVNTPVLTCGDGGIEWKAISEVESGEYVAVPRYGKLDRSAARVRDYLELTTEKVQLADESVEFLREGLYREFGTLRDAAAALALSEDFIYDSLANRHVPLEKLDRILEAIGAVRDDLQFDRLMLRHGDSITLPETFDDELMYLLGLVFGDGDISLDERDGNRGCVRISNGDETLLKRAADIVARTFDKQVDIEYQDDRVPCIRIHSATIARLFANAGMQSPKADLALDPSLTTAEHADAFLRGLMDADGAVSARTNGGSSVLFSTISEELARQVQLMLETYGVRARTRERDRRGTYELANGQTIESKHVQHFVECYGADIDRYADAIGFELPEKRAALDTIVGDAERRADKIPVGSALAAVDGPGGPYYQNINRGDDPGRGRARAMLEDRDLGAVESLVEEAVDADLRWDEVVAAVDTGEKEVFDLTVPETHNFVGNGVVTHNTAAAVRDDFGDGQQWTLEAGALVLADRGIAAVDELDKMRCVTGDTRIQLGDRTMRIRDFAAEAAASGSIEHLPNGRTIRDVDAEAWTMTDDGRLVKRSVTAVHEYDAPETLTEVTLQTGEVVTSTADHPYFVFEGGERVEKPAEVLTPGDQVYVPSSDWNRAADGGTALTDTDEYVNDNGDIDLGRVERVTQVQDTAYDRVYDITVEDTHNFVANGMIVHNSEDRSAMHEALEQQSYHPNSEVLLADGRRVEIGDFVDGAMAERPDEVVDGVNCEILPLNDVRIHSVDLETNETTKQPVDRVSRHEAPDEFVRVTFSNGRDVLVTPEHPMFADVGGEVGTAEARNIEEGAFVPAPRKLPNSAAGVELDGEPHIGKEQDVDLPDELSEDLAEILGFLTAEGHSYAGSSHEIGFSNQDERLLARMDDLMTREFGLSSTDATNAAGTVTQRWVSTKLYRWFESNFPEFMHTARDKRIPSRVLGASEEHIRRFLVGAFAGDGGVESEAMSFSTASEGLAEDYADALSKIGVASRIHHDTAGDSWKVYVMGDSTERFVETVVEPADDRHEQAQAFVERSNAIPRHHDVLPTSAAREIRDLRSLVGLSLTGQFRSTLDEGFGVQVETVSNQLEEIRARVTEVREAITDADDLTSIRNAVDWSGRELAERLDGVTTSRVHYAEDGGYDAETRRELANRARAAVLDALKEAERRCDALEARCDLRYYRVTDVETVPNEGEYATEWVYDVTVEPTNTFVSQGVVLHNSISVSKAGINATLKSRCSLLGAANPKYGRFDQYEPIGEQIDLEPALISRFDLIFTVTDDPNEEEDRALAEHIINTNYAGELFTHRENNATSNITQEQVDDVSQDVTPVIDADLLRKYIAYAKRHCYPTMTPEAKEAIRDFYVDLRARGQDEDSPVPVTARKLEALVRLAEASARVRLSDTVEKRDAEEVIRIVRDSLEAIGVDPETGEFDADIVEAGTSKSQRDRIKNIKGIIKELEEEYEDGAPIDKVIERAQAIGMDESKAEHEIQKLKNKGDIYEPNMDHLRAV
ncbi:LAGLIDADG family homing endonuclease [Natronomonas sp. EA1]|uniref:LAGLIDADG family homing endonuclease n=1 Tax=Natronomonas sp. EA1 TaxID=3421655 RepID=UPI003EBA5090